MLKERIEFLSKKKQISRKDLVDGLVTQAHFANILAERYALPEDLAEAIAERLGVQPSYLLLAAAQDEETLSRAEAIFDRLSVAASAIPEEQVHALDDRDDTLTVELTTALMKAVYYQQLNDASAHEYIHSSYLNFYLEKYGRPDDSDLPRPLYKALLYYKIQYYRSKHAFVEVLTHATRLSSLLLQGSEFWLSMQNIKMEAYIQVRQYEEAKQVFEQTMRHVVDQRLFHRLSGLYVAYSGYCFTMGLVQEALSALTMAEANLVYTSNQGELMTAIANNRIVMLTISGELDQAMTEIERFESLLQQESEETQHGMKPLILIYRCEIALARKDWGMLALSVDHLLHCATTQDQQMSGVFYQSQLALAHGNQSVFMERALACLPYFESAQHFLRLEHLYEGLAVVSEDQRKYKEAAIYYKKLVYLLRNK
ncbi:XRE family transcriptional regulator [Paenibacillus sp. MER 99-2]|uniref:XRE family transcriptional regulator n=1 Tax=Paenibacillus sp. MER 99-2 TaxID=2939572 RepID=UPI00203C2193|nr:XRE family transcriptional regulator [Paenibacillus sp. MER 99-2]MCM3170692.1 XRE family transcriptional regulator [Paenibacillus sp. MER 99-2]